MSTVSTLTSLAILKVNIDQGRDYLDYLRPFILQILADEQPNTVTDVGTRDSLSSQYGLEVPERSVQLVLKRLAREKYLERSLGVYRITGDLPNPGLAAKKADANRHIDAVVSGLIKFSKSSIKPVRTSEDAVNALLGFLSEFCIPSLRAFLRGTTIPILRSKQKAHLVLVSDYVLHLQDSSPERFESFLVMLQGHMLANALLCPDLQNAPKSYKNVTFYLDTPLLVPWLGLEGEPRERAFGELIRLLSSLGATISIFSHSRNELKRVL